MRALLEGPRRRGGEQLKPFAQVRYIAKVARILAVELGKDQTWVSQQVAGFKALAAQYLPSLAAAQTRQR